MVERTEYRWVLRFAIVVAVITLVPYLIGYSRQGEGWVFTGFLFGVEDGNSYIAKMLSGAEGAWLFRTPYTHFPQNGVFLYFPFLLLGKLSAPPGQHDQLVALYHIFRTLSAVGLVFATYDFLAIFIKAINLRRFGTTLMIFGGGLGWISLVGFSSLWQNELPLDFYSPEAFGFLMVFGLPHLALARALMLWGLRDFLDLDHSYNRWRSSLKGLLLWTLVGLLQPISIAITWVMIAIFIMMTGLWQAILYQQKQYPDWSTWVTYCKRAIWTGILSAPLLVYTLLVFRLDPFLRLWEHQNLLISPPIHHYLLAYGLILPVALVGIRTLNKQLPWKSWLVIGWSFAWLVLAYLPVSIQRRLVEGAWFMLVILAIVWLENQNKPITKIMTSVFSLSFLSTCILLIGSLLAAWNRTPTAFRPVDEVKIFKYLAQKADEGEIVLAAFDTSNALPAWASAKTITGHGPESIDAWKIREEVNHFFSSYTDQERLQLLNRYQVDYVIWARTDQLAIHDLANLSYLDVIYQSNEYYLLRVNQTFEGDG